MRRTAKITVGLPREQALALFTPEVDRAYERYVERIGRKPAPMLDDYALKLRDAIVLVAEDREVVGVIVLIIKDDHLLIENVAVDPSRQGRGAGARSSRRLNERLPSLA